MHSPQKVLCGVVVSAGKMMKAAKVRTAKQVYDSFFKKHFQTYESHLVADPSGSLRTGDVVRITSGWHRSKLIKHRVTEIVTPWGPPINERPRIPTDEELQAIHSAKKAAKMERRAQRREKGEIAEGAPQNKPRPGGVEALMEVAK